MATLQAASNPVNGRSDSAMIAYTLLLAATLHIAMILGIGFIAEDKKPVDKRHQSLRVVLVPPQKLEQPNPEKVHLLSQTDTRGSGKTEFTQPADRPIDNALMQQESAPASVETVALMQPTMPQAQALPVLVPEPVEAIPPPSKPSPAVTTPASSSSPATPPSIVSPAPKPLAKPRPKAPTVKPPKRRISASQLLASRSDEIARLTSELQRKSAAYAKRTKRKAISASTTEYKYATYMEAWRRKVERIGNLNYPDEARRKKLYGNLLLHVAVRSDGSVERVRILKSSGHKLLDDAAMRIVRMAAPYAPFPEGIRRDVDVLDITRTWQFLNNNRLGWK